MANVLQEKSLIDHHSVFVKIMVVERNLDSVKENSEVTPLFAEIGQN